ncbi:MAG: hypothetical protein ACK47B_04570 [Armatimonadota bacterium]
MAARIWDNPVARHASRLGRSSGRAWAVLLLLFVAGAAGAALQRYWLEMAEYAFLRPRMLDRWIGMSLVAETVIALPWAAVRGALLWRRLERDGHLEEYRRTRLSPLTITAGALAAVLYPVTALLALSLGVALAVALGGYELPVFGTIQAHLLLLVQSAAFAALGLWLTSRVRYPALAVPLALLILAAAILALAGLEPFYRQMETPERWINWALLPNPVTAVGSALETDVLRFGWLYRHLSANEYFYVYPPVWQTAGVYGALAALCLWRVTRQLSKD